ncbi:hypothetical protein [Amycolatopsis sp. NPDC051903]|uniref:hypothetical protein n=1 Tax=Amycolatopsis sp. NPDC051903 TaxID=3363936 RepID=UPI0037B1D924
MDLGPLVSSHPTDDDQRRVAGIAVLALAVVALGAGIPLSVSIFSRPFGPGETSSERPEALAGALTVGGVVLLVVAVLKLIKWARCRGEVIEVHERGLLRGAEAIPWSAIATVHPQGSEVTGPRHALAFDFRCVVRLTDGRRFTFAGHTENATELAKAIEAAVA